MHSGIMSIAKKEFSSASPVSGVGSCPLNSALNGVQMRQLRESVDCVIVILHGGNEHYPFASIHLNYVTF
jgi:hypothetical protein